MRVKWRNALFLARVPGVADQHRTPSSRDTKKPSLIDLANLLQVETAPFGTNPPSDAQSIAPRTVRGWRGQTPEAVRDALDRRYAAIAGNITSSRQL